MGRSRRPRGQHPIKLPKLYQESKRNDLHFMYQFDSFTGTQKKRRRKLPAPSTPYSRGELPYPARPQPRQHRPQIERLTSGTNKSQADLDLLELRPYRWRGRANKQAHRVWAQIKDKLPTDAELTRWSAQHELLRDGEIVWE